MTYCHCFIFWGSSTQLVQPVQALMLFSRPALAIIKALVAWGPTLWELFPLSPGTETTSCCSVLCAPTPASRHRTRAGRSFWFWSCSHRQSRVVLAALMLYPWLGWKNEALALYDTFRVNTWCLSGKSDVAGCSRFWSDLNTCGSAAQALRTCQWKKFLPCCIQVLEVLMATRFPLCLAEHSCPLAMLIINVC